MKKLFYLFLLLSNFNLPTTAQDSIYLKKYFGDLKQIDVLIDGKAYPFLFDTGGGETFISPEIAAGLNKQVYGNASGFRMHGELVRYQKCDSCTLKISRSNFFHTTIGVWDAMTVLPKEFPKIYGILSLKTFQNDMVTLDLAHNLLVIETENTYRNKISSMQKINCRFANGMDANELTLFIEILHSGRSYWYNTLIFLDRCLNFKLLI